MTDKEEGGGVVVVVVVGLEWEGGDSIHLLSPGTRGAYF